MNSTPLPYPGNHLPPPHPSHSMGPAGGHPSHGPGPYTHQQPPSHPASASSQHPPQHSSHYQDYRQVPTPMAAGPVVRLGAGPGAGPVLPMVDTTGVPAAKEPKELGDLPKHDAPKPVEGSDGDRIYRLVVDQQPIRARMCGFGDKDRRPITPPPCVRLAVINKLTGGEVNVNDVDHQHYVLTVDLWSYDGTKEVNLVKHSPNSPSISASTAQSFRELDQAQSHPQGPPAPGYQSGYAGQASSGAPGYGQRYSTEHYGQNGYYPPMQQQQYGYASHGQQTVPSQQHSFQGRYPNEMGHQRLSHLQTQQVHGMYTRNLIGSLAASAARLNDANDKVGIWFVLQDLSVRTEGFFRLRFSYSALGVPNSTTNGQTSDSLQLNKAKSRVLAQSFSDIFQVFSAKKFPGVCESTPLSKTFAAQGVKIPIRKEGESGGGRGRKNSDDDDDDE